MKMDLEYYLKLVYKVTLNHAIKSYKNLHLTFNQQQYDL